MMKVLLLLTLAAVTLTAIALFIAAEENDADGRKFDYWVSPDPFLHMSRITSGLPPRRAITKDGLGPRLQ
jgi:hypothetical protein